MKNEILKKTLWILSISRNAIIVLITAIIAYCFEQQRGSVPFRLSGVVRSGLPSMRIPHFSTNLQNDTVPFPEMISTLGSAIFVVPLTGVLANVAIAKAFGEYLTFYKL